MPPLRIDSQVYLRRGRFAEQGDSAVYVFVHAHEGKVRHAARFTRPYIEIISLVAHFFRVTDGRQHLLRVSVVEPDRRGEYPKQTEYLRIFQSGIQGDESTHGTSGHTGCERTGQRAVMGIDIGLEDFYDESEISRAFYLRIFGVRTEIELRNA